MVETLRCGAPGKSLDYWSHGLKEDYCIINMTLTSPEYSLTHPISVLVSQESALGFIRLSLGLGLIGMLRALTVIKNIAQTFIGMAFLKHGL